MRASESVEVSSEFRTVETSVCDLVRSSVNWPSSSRYERATSKFFETRLLLDVRISSRSSSGHSPARLADVFGGTRFLSMYRTCWVMLGLRRPAASGSRSRSSSGKFFVQQRRQRAALSTWMPPAFDGQTTYNWRTLQVNVLGLLRRPTPRNGRPSTPLTQIRVTRTVRSSHAECQTQDVHDWRSCRQVMARFGPPIACAFLEQADLETVAEIGSYGIVTERSRHRTFRSTRSRYRHEASSSSVRGWFLHVPARELATKQARQKRQCT